MNDLGPIRETGRNPYVNISKGWRIAIVLYFFLVEFFPAAVFPIIHGTSDPYTAQRILLRLLLCCLMAFPFFVSRFGGVRMGWFHPIAMSTLMATAIQVIRFPQSLLAPITVLIDHSEDWTFHPAVLGFADEAMYSITLKGEFLKLVALVSTYLGFAICSCDLGRERIYVRLKRDVRPVLITLAMLGLCVAAYVVHANGGLSAHMAQFALGRFTAVGDIGHLTAFIAFAPIALVVLYLFQPAILRNVAFWLVFPLSCIAQFVVTGSRSAVLLPVMFLAAVWVFSNRHIPAGRLAAIGAASWLILGFLGEIRNTVWHGEPGVEMDAVLAFEPSELVAVVNEQMTGRVRGDMYIPTIAFVPELVPYLHGSSYVAVLAAFIPRAIWESKPRGVDAYAGAMIFEGLETADGFVGMATPPGPVAESYWNFGIAGVVVVFFLFGMVRKLIAEMYEVSSLSIPAAATFLLSVFFFSTPSGPDVIRFIRFFAFLTVAFLICGLRLERVHQ